MLMHLCHRNNEGMTRYMTHWLWEVDICLKCHNQVTIYWNNGLDEVLGVNKIIAEMLMDLEADIFLLIRKRSRAYRKYS